MMLQLFQEYRKQVKADPILKNDFAGKDADEVVKKLERPLTMEGFECFVFDQGIINDLGDYFSNKNGKYSDFSTICSHVKRVIRRDQIEGGMAGIYNPSITQRLNNLREQTNTELTGKDGGPIQQEYNLTLNLNK